MSPLSRLVHHALNRVRLIGSAVFGLVLFAALAPWMPTSRAMLVAFDAAALLFLVLMGLLMVHATPHTLERRAHQHEEGKWAVLAVSLTVAGVVLGALYNELHAAKVKSLGDIALASSSILMSWLFVVVFSQQYAHSYYLKPAPLVFPGTERPDYWDFMYFASVISMCCQTSDVAVTSGAMRRLVMLHSLVSFFFNVIILAISVNVVAGVF